VRSTLSRGRRRTGPDLVPPRARLDPDDREVSRLQAAYSIRRQRSHRHWTGGMSSRYQVRIADQLDTIESRALTCRLRSVWRRFALPV